MSGLWLGYKIDFCKNKQTKKSAHTAQKIKFSIKEFFSKCDQTRFPAELVTLTEEILNGKLQCLVQWQRSEVASMKLSWTREANQAQGRKK